MNHIRTGLILEKQPNLYNSLLHYFCNGEYLLAYLCMVNNDNAKILLTEIHKLFSANDVPLFLEWGLFCFIMKFLNISPENKLDIFEKMYQFHLNQIHDNSLEEIIYYAKNPEVEPQFKDDSQIHNIGFFLLLFKENYPVLFRIFKQNLKKLVNSLNADLLLNNLGIPSLSFFDVCPTHSIENFDIEPHMLTEVLEETYNPEIIKSLQNRIVSLYPYPNDYPNLPNSTAQSFLNSAISTNTHIFDILNKLFFDCINLGDIEKVPTLVRVSPIVVPYLILAYQPTIYNDFDKYYRLIAATLPNSPAQKIQVLMQKDIQIINLINFLCGGELKMIDLLQHTLPFHLQYVLHQKQLIEFNTFYGFVYSQKDWNLDFDFIYSYNALKTVIELGSTKINLQDIVSKKLESLQMFLKLVKDKEILNHLTIDIFSFLFIQKEDKFIFCKSIATPIINILYLFNENYFIKLAKMALMTPNKGNDLCEYFGLNRAVILKAMADKRWAEARLLANISPQYRKDFILGSAMYSLCNLHCVHISCSDYPMEFNIEVGLSTYSIEDSLDFARNNYKCYDSVIEKRLMTPKIDLLFPLPNNQSWKPIMEIIDDISPSYVFENDFSKFHEILSKAQNFQTFLENMKLFHRCFLLSPEFSVDAECGDAIHLTIENILSGPISSCNIKLALYVARLLNVNLFEFVLKHINEFHITLGFLEAFCDEYPIECSALAMTKLLPEEQADLPSGIKIFPLPSKESIEENSPNEKVLFMTAVTALDNPGTSVEFYDDLLFRINHSEFCEAVLNKIDRIPEETLFYILDIVGYTMNDKLKEKHKALLMRMKIQKYLNFEKHPKTIKETTQTEIIDILMKRNEINFIINYIDTVLSSSFEMVLYVSKILKGASLHQFLRYFPQYHERLLYEYDEIIPILLSFKKDEAFQSFALLPREIRQNSSLSNPKSIVDSFIKNPKLISSIQKDICYLLNDSELTEIFQNAPKGQFLHISINFLKIMKNPSLIYEIIKQNINEKVDQISVENTHDEDNAIQTLRVIYDFINNSLIPSNNNSLNNSLKNEKFYWKIEILYKFVNYHPYYNSSISYYFYKNYENIIKICLNIDIEDDLSYDLCNIFDYDTLDFLLKRAYIPNSLYQLNIVQEMFQDYEKRSGKTIVDFTRFNFEKHPYAQIDLINNNSPFLLPYQKVSFFNSDAMNIIIQTGIESLAPNASPAPLQIYRECQFFCKRKREKFKPPYQTQKCLLFIRRYASIECNLRMSIFFDDFDNVLPNLMMIENINDRHLSFVHAVFGPAVSKNVQTALFKTLDQFKQGEPLVIDLFDSLIHFLHEKKLYYSLEFLYSEMKQLDDLAKSEVNIFRVNNNILKQVYYINSAYFNFKKALHDHISLHDNEKIIRRYKKLCKLQKIVCELVIEKNITNLESSIDIIHNDDAAAYAGSLIMKHCEEKTRRHKIINQICKMKQISKKQIISKLCTNFKDATMEELTKFLQSAKDELNYLEDYLEEVLRIVSSSEKIFHLIPMLIYFSVDSDEIKVKLFIEYDFLVEAFTILSNQKPDEVLSEYFPIIAYRASLLSIDDLVENCIKIMK
ncbi:hypothetical protein TRFO_30214 [Tritrichomonas foetus]|uniref:Uncharacterized protein n=1 Tax=Tritrichomonas foetus TaxID=1144522 RepID=A0A1J4JYQ7_9EUKA|nr:hypothetical protein TRFO_30214 [Tritrichomonas foetus]|eukprot:OHT02668.1 hypothetical protein TRFO_30214 [Tritrichomonas foetus]